MKLKDETSSKELHETSSKKLHETSLKDETNINMILFKERRSRTRLINKVQHLFFYILYLIDMLILIKL